MKRLDADGRCDSTGDPYAVVVESEDGDLVWYVDAKAQIDERDARIAKLEGLLRQASGILQCVAYAGPGKPQILADIDAALREGT